MTDTTETPKPCPFCNDPMTDRAGKFGHVDRHAGCLLAKLEWPAEPYFLGPWNDRHGSALLGVDPDKVGYRMHATHDADSAGVEAREALAAVMENQFPVEAQMARSGLHFMLPSSWAAEAIQAVLDNR